MEINQPGVYEPPTMVHLPIKIERDDGDDQSCDGLDSDIPCVSTVPIPVEKRISPFYYPSQAMGSPRTHSFSAVEKMAQKRKNFQTILQTSLLIVEEPVLFEETISDCHLKIVLFDTKTKQIVPRDNLAYEKPSTIGQSSHEMETTETMTNPGETRLNSPCQRHVTQPEIDNQTSNIIASSCNITSPHNITSLSHNVSSSSHNTPSLPHNIASSPDWVTANNTSAVPTISRTFPSQLADVRSKSTVDSPQHRPSLLNSLPLQRMQKERIEKIQGYKQFSPTQHELSTTQIVSVRSETSSIARPETNSKMGVCLPNKSQSKMTNLTPVPSRDVFVPREVNLGQNELRLEDCINVRDICDKELTRWTAEDVAKFVRETDCSEYAHVFVDQEIDGKALTLLNQDLLIQWMKLKLGPAMKLNCHIINLRNSLNNS